MDFIYLLINTKGLHFDFKKIYLGSDTDAVTVTVSECSKQYLYDKRDQDVLLFYCSEVALDLSIWHRDMVTLPWCDFQLTMELMSIFLHEAESGLYIWQQDLDIRPPLSYCSTKVNLPRPQGQRIGYYTISMQHISQNSSFFNDENDANALDILFSVLQ